MLSHRLRHRIAFERLERERDSETGEYVEVWVGVWLSSGVQLNSVPAEVLTGEGKEFIAGGATQSQFTARINLRWFPGLSAAWRIIWDGQIYNITSIAADITGRREWRLRCEGGVSDGQ